MNYKLHYFVLSLFRSIENVQKHAHDCAQIKGLVGSWVGNQPNNDLFWKTPSRTSPIDEHWHLPSDWKYDHIKLWNVSASRCAALKWRSVVAGFTSATQWISVFSGFLGDRRWRDALDALLSILAAEPRNSLELLGQNDRFINVISAGFDEVT